MLQLNQDTALFSVSARTFSLQPYYPHLTAACRKFLRHQPSSRKDRHFGELIPFEESGHHLKIILNRPDKIVSEYQTNPNDSEDLHKAVAESRRAKALFELLRDRYGNRNSRDGVSYWEESKKEKHVSSRWSTKFKGKTLRKQRVASGCEREA